MTSRLLLAAIILNLVGLMGCKKEPENAGSASATTVTPRAAVSLKLLVIGDPELAEAARLLRGEWAERSGGNLEVEEVEASEFKVAELPAADVVVFPTQRLAELVIEKKLRPVRRSILDSDSFAFDDILPLVRNEVMRFGGEVFAISLGEAPLMLARRDESAGGEPVERANGPPQSWKRVAEMAPHSGGRPSLELIARAASLVDPRLRSELLFDPKDMTPRLSAPHFERALQQMAEVRGADGTTGFYQIACPTASILGENPSWQFSELPKAEENFNAIRNRWEPQTVGPPLCVLGFSGRCAGVTASTRNATSAFKLIAWLTSGTPATRISSGSGATTLFRNSQRQKAEKWLGKSGRQSLPVLLELLSTGEPYQLARIPGIEQYLQVLDDCVQRARRGEAPAGEILKSASDHWGELTESLGKDRQRRCYRLHLGLEDWKD